MLEGIIWGYKNEKDEVEKVAKELKQNLKGKIQLEDGKFVGCCYVIGFDADDGAEGVLKRYNGRVKFHKKTNF